MKYIQYTLLNGLFLTLLGCNGYVVLDHYDDGSIKYKCQMTGSQKNGECIYYFQDGSTKQIESYSKGKLNGQSSFWYHNGQLHWRAEYTEDKKNGLVKYYDSLGQLYQETTFLDNELHGVSKSYFSSGNLKSFGKYRVGTPIDTHRIFFEDNKIKLIQIFTKEGLLEDYSKYDEKGNLVDSLIEYEFAVSDSTGYHIVSIRMTNPMYDFMGVVVGKLDSINHSVVDTLRLEQSEDYEIMFSLKSSNSDNYLEGIIYDLEDLGNNKAVVKRSLTFKLQLPPDSPSS